MEFIKKIISAILVVTHFVMIIGVMPVSAAVTPSPNYVCGQDLNNNGYLGDEG